MECDMEGMCKPTLSFGIFDHLDHAGGSLRKQYSDRLEIAAACDAAGFRAYHVAEHHGTPHCLAASPNLFLSAVAQRTRKLRVGPLVMLLNPYHPLRAFEEICMLDQLSGGRVDLGIGRGAVPVELSFFGVSAEEAQDRSARRPRLFSRRWRPIGSRTAAGISASATCPYALAYPKAASTAKVRDNQA
jgi:alkanesulfonate monooxygenase SsuD/methylene tetrahydromethanopterin reductase-like flavin-dependent oxidoreductase (luciferase family)